MSNEHSSDKYRVTQASEECTNCRGRGRFPDNGPRYDNLPLSLTPKFLRRKCLCVFCAGTGRLTDPRLKSMLGSIRAAIRHSDNGRGHHKN